ncbi:hypothetical protein GCM10027446_11410 [Angustibacter peucedani]
MSVQASWYDDPSGAEDFGSSVIPDDPDLLGDEEGPAVVLDDDLYGHFSD